MTSSMTKKKKKLIDSLNKLISIKSLKLVLSVIKLFFFFTVLTISFTKLDIKINLTVFSITINAFYNYSNILNCIKVLMYENVFKFCF